MNETKVFMCECGEEALVVSNDDGCGINLAMFNRYFNKYTWREKLRCIWHILKTGKPYTDQMCLDYDTGQRLARFLNKLAKTKAYW